MLKAIATNPLLSEAFNKEESFSATESRLFVLTKYQFERNKASHLHRLFFGKDASTAVAFSLTKNTPADPDDFSSYE
ncbi:MAG: hypothetical protein K2X48_09210 [Chitinophagaceae bacterium]|nr:hypothetical protein [Chitinophagaceae bacterium]